MNSSRALLATASMILAPLLVANLTSCVSEAEAASVQLIGFDLSNDHDFPMNLAVEVTDSQGALLGKQCQRVLKASQQHLICPEPVRVPKGGTWKILAQPVSTSAWFQIDSDKIGSNPPHEASVERVVNLKNTEVYEGQGALDSFYAIARTVGFSRGFQTAPDSDVDKYLGHLWLVPVATDGSFGTASWDTALLKYERPQMAPPTNRNAATDKISSDVASKLSVNFPAYGGITANFGSTSVKSVEWNLDYYRLRFGTTQTLYDRLVNLTDAERSTIEAQMTSHPNDRVIFINQATVVDNGYFKSYKAKSINGMVDTNLLSVIKGNGVYQFDAAASTDITFSHQIVGVSFLDFGTAADVRTAGLFKKNPPTPIVVSQGTPVNPAGNVAVIHEATDAAGFVPTSNGQ